MKLADYLEVLRNETFQAGDRDGFDKNDDNYHLLKRNPLPKDWYKKMTGCPNNVPDWDYEKWCEENPTESNEPFPIECQHCWLYAIQVPGFGALLKNKDGTVTEVFPHPITEQEIIDSVTEEMTKVFGNLMEKNNVKDLCR
jgi:hypothetical protein